MISVLVLNKNNVIIYHDKFNRTPPSLNVLYGVNLIENLLFFCETLDGAINASKPLIKWFSINIEIAYRA